jgi:hypothetical protein
MYMCTHIHFIMTAARTRLKVRHSIFFFNKRLYPGADPVLEVKGCYRSLETDCVEAVLVPLIGLRRSPDPIWGSRGSFWI